RDLLQQLVPRANGAWPHLHWPVAPGAAGVRWPISRRDNTRGESPRRRIRNDEWDRLHGRSHRRRFHRHARCSFNTGDDDASLSPMTKLIVEVCQNHKGDRETLAALIDQSAANGADIVKMQSIFSDDLARRERFETGETAADGSVKTIQRPFAAEKAR